MSISVMWCGSAVGECLLPMVAYKSRKFVPGLSSGWITRYYLRLYQVWMVFNFHRQSHTKPSEICIIWRQPSLPFQH